MPRHNLAQLPPVVVESLGFALARYGEEDRLDPTFGSGSKVFTEFGVGKGFANALIIQPDGKIVAAAQAQDACTGRNVALARHNPNASLDTSFNTKKIVDKVNSSSDSSANAIALQGTQIVIAGSTTAGSSPESFLPRSVRRPSASWSRPSPGAAPR